MVLSTILWMNCTAVGEISGGIWVLHVLGVARVKPERGSVPIRDNQWKKVEIT
jgi:hypothetical protein